jgi:ribosomal protein S18 acetylase RimI-like enzyme
VTAPDVQALFRVLAATWPPASIRHERGWTLRDGAGGGKRVSAATADPGASAEDAPDLVMIRPWDIAIETTLANRGYLKVDETRLYLSPVAPLTGDLPHGTAYWSRQRLAIMEDIWAAGGIGPGRLAIMDRTGEPRSTLLCRAGDRAAGTGFVAMAEEVAMIHALEVLAEHRRSGVGKLMVRCAANWTQARDGHWISLAVTSANVPACALYESLGMAEVARYHYRMRTT